MSKLEMVLLAGPSISVIVWAITTRRYWFHAWYRWPDGSGGGFSFAPADQKQGRKRP